MTRGRLMIVRIRRAVVWCVRRRGGGSEPLHPWTDAGWAIVQAAVVTGLIIAALAMMFWVGRSCESTLEETDDVGSVEARP